MQKGQRAYMVKLYSLQRPFPFPPLSAPIFPKETTQNCLPQHSLPFVSPPISPSLNATLMSLQRSHLGKAVSIVQGGFSIQKRGLEKQKEGVGGPKKKGK